MISCAPPGVYGARFSGAGCQDCCIDLSDPAYREEIRVVVGQYPAQHPDMAERYSVHFGKLDGAARVLSAQIS